MNQFSVSSASHGVSPLFSANHTWSDLLFSRIIVAKFWWRCIRFKKPKQVPRSQSGHFSKKCIQCCIYGISWLKADTPEERLLLPPINSFLLCTCHDPNSLPSLISLFNRFPKPYIAIRLPIVSYLLVLASYCFGILNASKRVNEGVLRTIPWKILWHQVVKE